MQNHRGMGVPPMEHGQDARATPANKGFCKSLSVLRLGFAGHHLEEAFCRRRADVLKGEVAVIQRADALHLLPIPGSAERVHRVERVPDAALDVGDRDGERRAADNNARAVRGENRRGDAAATGGGSRRVGDGGRVAGAVRREGIGAVRSQR